MMKASTGVEIKVSPSPTKAKVLTLKDVQEIGRICGCGFTVDKACKIKDFSHDIFQEHMHKYPNLLSCFEKAKESINYNVANSLYSKVLRGDTTAMIWWTKARMGWRETRTFEFQMLREIYGKANVEDIPVNDMEVIEMAAKKALKG